jgi:hypothetical protein
MFQFFLLPLLEPERLRRPFRNWRWLSVPDMQIDIQGAGHITDLGRAARVVGIVALFGAIMVTHQLSPYVVFAGVVALWVLGVLRHRLLVLVIMIMLMAYALLHMPAIEQNPVLNIFDLSNTIGVKGFTQASPPQVLGSELAKVVCVGLWGATAVCALSYRRRLGTVVIPLIWAAVPLLIVLVSAYGGEGINRAFLFSSPWSALIIAMRLADMVRAPVRRLAAVGLWAMFSAFATAQSQDFGQYPVIQVPLAEVHASEYFDDYAPVNSALVEAVYNFPGRPNGRYVLHNPTQSPVDLALDGRPSFKGNKLERMSPRALALSVASIANGSGYLVIAPSMYPYLNFYATLAPGTLQALVQRLIASAYWQLWYESDGTYIFRALPQGQPAQK